MNIEEVEEVLTKIGKKIENRDDLTPLDVKIMIIKEMGLKLEEDDVEKISIAFSYVDGYVDHKMDNKNNIMYG